MAMDQMPPKAPAPAAPEAEGPGEASQLVVEIQESMGKLQELLGQKFPEDAAKLSQIMGAYEALVDGLGQSPDAPKVEQPGPKGPVPMESGGKPGMPVI